MTVRIGKEPLPLLREWFDDRDNLYALWCWLEERDDSPDPAGFLRSPWDWTPEWNRMIAEVLRAIGGDGSS